MKQFNRKTKTSHTTTSQAAIISVAFFSSCTILSGMILSSSTTHADTVTSNATVNVNMSCTMSAAPGTGGTATTDGYLYSTTIDPGTHKEIEGSILTTSCNGTGNYSLYAIGYSGDSYDTPINTQMIGSGTSAGTNIVTGTATSGGTSNWAFKLINSGTYSPTIISPYNNYANIPGDDFVKVANYIPGTTGSASSSSVQAKYQVYVASNQLVGDYTGKVKYTMVYPNDAPAPTPPAPGLCTDRATCMQTMTTCPTTPTTVTDGRDGVQYLVQQLADGNCWMLDNLRLGGSSAMNLTPNDTNIASNWTLPASTTTGFDDSTGYTTAAVNADYKSTTTTSYGVGSGKIGNYYNYCAASGGTYCYTSGSGTGDAQYDICPAGWRMPTGGSSGEYEALYTAYNSDATNFKTALSTPLSGYFYVGSAYLQGSRGYFWSSTYNSSSFMYYLYVTSSNVYPTDNVSRRYGHSLRCLLGV